MREELKYSIYIDTSTKEHSIIILYKINNAESEIMQEIDKMECKGDVLEGIRKIINKNSLSINDISIIKANKGPGSFTGLRTGLTISNIINWVKGNTGIGNLDLPEYGNDPNITPPKNFKF